jgi:hypothetical protein
MNLAEHAVFHQVLDRSLANGFRVYDYTEDHVVVWQMRDSSYVLEKGWLDVDSNGKPVFEYTYYPASELQWEDADDTTDGNEDEFYGYELEDELSNLDEQYLDEECDV